MFKKRNLIKKLIVTSIVILSTGNIIASEKDKNNPLANNNQLVQNNNLADTGATLNVNKINELLKPAGIDIDEGITLFMQNPSMLINELTNAGCNISELETLLNNNPMLVNDYIWFSENNINAFELLKKNSAFNNVMRSMMTSNEVSKLIKAFIDNNDSSNKTASCFKAFFKKEDVTENLFYAYQQENIRDIIDTCSKANIIIPKESNETIDSVIDALFNDFNKSNDINDYVKKYYNLLPSIIADKEKVNYTISSNINIIKSMEQENKDKLKEYLLYYFKTLLKTNNNKLVSLKKGTDYLKQTSKQIKTDQRFKANMSDSQIEKLNKLVELFTYIITQEMIYIKGIQEVAKAVGITSEILDNDPAQANNTQQNVEQNTTK